jgi:hypothetical protein
MAQARHAEQSIPTSAFLVPAALAVALVLGLIVALGIVGTRPIVLEEAQNRDVSPALIQAGRDWQAQREQQSGYTDPLIQAGRDWQVQREQQSGYTDPLIQAGRDWQAQREQQSGGYTLR